MPQLIFLFHLISSHFIHDQIYSPTTDSSATWLFHKLIIFHSLSIDLSTAAKAVNNFQNVIAYILGQNSAYMRNVAKANFLLLRSNLVPHNRFFNCLSVIQMYIQIVIQFHSAPIDL